MRFWKKHKRRKTYNSRSMIAASGNSAGWIKAPMTSEEKRREKRESGAYLGVQCRACNVSRSRLTKEETSGAHDLGRRNIEEKDSADHEK